MACVPAKAQDAQADATFIDAAGEAIGSARLLDSGDGVLIELDVRGLPENSWVAFHIHEHGACDPADGFESAGDHFNPDDRAHGYFASGGPHIGDMPNQYVGADGTLLAQVFNHLVSLDGEENGARGRSLMFHEGADDYSSQPSGHAGDRIACAVIE
nr:superoxide dismutase family protein [Pelagibacterium limicola]